MAAVRVQPIIEKESFLRQEVDAKVQVEKKSLKEGAFHLIIRREVDSTYNPLKNGEIEFIVVHQEIATVVPAFGKEDDDWIIKIHRKQDEKSRFDGTNVVEKVSHRRIFLERNMENPIMKDVAARAQSAKQAEEDAEKTSLGTASSGDYYELTTDESNSEMAIVYPENDAIVVGGGTEKPHILSDATIVGKEKLLREDTWTKLRPLEDGEFIREKQEANEDVQLTSEERIERRQKRVLDVKVAQKKAASGNDFKMVVVEEIKEPRYEIKTNQPNPGSDDIITLEPEEELEIINGETASNYVEIREANQLKRSSFQSELSEKTQQIRRKSQENQGRYVIPFFKGSVSQPDLASSPDSEYGYMTTREIFSGDDETEYYQRSSQIIPGVEAKNEEGEDYVIKKEILNEKQEEESSSLVGAQRVRELFHMDVSELIIERERRSK